MVVTKGQMQASDVFFSFELLCHAEMFVCGQGRAVDGGGLGSSLMRPPHFGTVVARFLKSARRFCHFTAKHNSTM